MQGNSIAQCNLGYCYQNGIGCTTNSKKAFEWYQKSAANGNNDGQNNLGNCYKWGLARVRIKL